jgi:hypothetical protein
MGLNKESIVLTYSNSFTYGTNAGNGVISGVNTDTAAVTETWTLVCTVAALDAGTFSVSGSVSGVQADATVAVAYDVGLIRFTIADGATDWVVGDTITIDVVRDVPTTTTEKDVLTVQLDQSGITTQDLNVLKGFTTTNMYSVSNNVGVASGIIDVPTNKMPYSKFVFATTIPDAPSSASTALTYNW